MARGKGEVAGFYINIKAPEIKIQNEKGHFTSAQAQMHEQNRELAQVLQSQVGRVLENTLLRPGVSSGRLLRATMDPKNRDYSWDYMGVGNAEFLDRSIAKYWRTIEEGSAATWTKRSFLSLELQGVWGTQISTGRWKFTNSDWISLGSQKGAPKSKGEDEMYSPLRKGRGGGPSGLPIFHPTKHIRPQGAYRYAAEQNYVQRYMLVGAVKFWNRILGDGISPRGFMGGIYDHGVG